MSSALELVADLPGHTDSAWQVAFNPTRSLLASCSTDRTVRLYQYHLEPDHAPRVEYLKTISTQHKKSVRSISWAPSGKTLATGSFDSSVAVWEEVDPDADDDGGEEGVYRPNGGGEAGPSGVAEGGGEKEWECVTTLEGHESECKSVAFSSDGALLASCSRDKSVWVWEVQPDSDFECIAVMMEHGQDVKCLAWHPHEEILASASYDSHIHLLFDDPDSDWLCFQKLHPKRPQTAVTLPSTSPLVPILFPSPAELEADEAIKLPPLEEDETVWCLAWAPGGQYLASGGDNGGIRIWSRQGNQPESNFVESIHTAAHAGPCFALSWSPGGLPEAEGGKGLLASGGADGRIIVWQVKAVGAGEGEEAEIAKVVIEPVGAVRHAHGESDVNGLQWCMREDGKGQGMLASAGDDGTVKVWRMVG